MEDNKTPDSSQVSSKPVTVDNPAPTPVAPVAGPPTSLQPASNTPLIVASLIIGAVILFGTIGAILYFTLGANDKPKESESTSRSTASTGNDSWERGVFTSDEFGFSAKFPGNPKKETLSEDIEGVAVPMTQYGYESSDGATAYMIQVAVYPEEEFDVAGNTRDSLQGALDGMEQSNGATLVDSNNDGDFLGYPAAEGTFDVRSRGESYSLYALNFVKDNSLYTIMTIGTDKSDFDDFVSSFKFTN